MSFRHIGECSVKNDVHPILGYRVPLSERVPSVVFDGTTFFSSVTSGMISATYV